MQDEDRIRVGHMIEAAEDALGFIAGRTRADLDTDRMLRLALMRAVEIVGEAASKVSDGTPESSPGFPGRHIIGMRNRLVHAYFDIDARYSLGCGAVGFRRCWLDVKALRRTR